MRGTSLPKTQQGSDVTQHLSSGIMEMIVGTALEWHRMELILCVDSEA